MFEQNNSLLKNKQMSIYSHIQNIIFALRFMDEWRTQRYK